MSFYDTAVMAVAYTDNGLAAGSGNYLSVRPFVTHRYCTNYQNG